VTACASQPARKNPKVVGDDGQRKPQTPTSSRTSVA